MPPAVLPLGDAAFTLALDDAPGPETSARLAAIAGRLEAEADGVLDLAPSFASLTVHFDPLATDAESLGATALRIAAETADAASPPGRAFSVPVCFAPEFGPDQEEVAGETGLSREAILELMTGAELTVLAVGFLPGFPFCGPAPEPLRLKRRSSPRLRVPKGSVAVANGFVGIYPWVSPGGWRVLGATAMPLFDAARERPATFAAGDRVRLRAVTRDEHEALGRSIEAGDVALDGFIEAGA